MKALTLLCCCLLLSASVFPRTLHRPQRTPVPWRPDKHRNIAAAHAGIGGVGALAYTAGLEYERFLTRKGLLSVAIPVARYQGGTIGGAHSGQIRNNIRGYYAAPGIRFHPMGSRYGVDPAIGAFLALGHERRTDSEYGDQGYSISSRRARHFLGAALGQVSVTFHSPDYIVAFGLFATGGYIFSHTYNTYSDHENSGDHLYLQFGLRLGGHW